MVYRATIPIVKSRAYPEILSGGMDGKIWGGKENFSQRRGPKSCPKYTPG